MFQKPVFHEEQQIKPPLFIIITLHLFEVPAARLFCSETVCTAVCFCPRSSELQSAETLGWNTTEETLGSCQDLSLSLSSFSLSPSVCPFLLASVSHQLSQLT